MSENRSLGVVPNSPQETLKHALAATSSSLLWPMQGWKGDMPRAISSAFTNSLQFNINGIKVNDAVVLPVPLQPQMI